MANLKNLAKKCKALPKEIKIAASLAAIVASKRLLNELWSITPVDTTKATSNWLVGIQKGIYSEREPYVPGFLGYTKTASVTAARKIAFTALEKKKPGQSVFIVNNVDYIMDLNRGSSKQAPARFVENCIFITAYAMKNYKLNIKV